VRISRLIIIRESLALVPDAISAPLLQFVVDMRQLMPVTDIELAPEGLDDWAEVFRIHQGYEIWQSLGPRITANHPTFGPGIKERFAWASTISKDQFNRAAKVRIEIRRRVVDAVGEDRVFILPTAPGIASMRDTPSEELEDFRNKICNCFALQALPARRRLAFGANWWMAGRSEYQFPARQAAILFCWISALPWGDLSETAPSQDH
jgi:amidase